ncbi:MAG TPA: thioredoxin family protein [Anaeromyxobacter sp.]|nr:thioredoxin family protein [Anaeromyxobacter sp.]
MRKSLVLLSLVAAPALAADVGGPAPEFSLPDLDGKVVKLSDLHGRTVVLEWFNPGCPFVRASHTRGTLVDDAARHQGAGVVWLAINSAAPGKQGYGVETNRDAARQYRMSYPVLLDESGQVGRAYGATNTPGMIVIDREGRLVYRGAIDNSPDGEQQAPQGGTLVDYVSAALDDLAAGRPVRYPETKQYGCSVKYRS